MKTNSDKEGDSQNVVTAQKNIRLTVNGKLHELMVGKDIQPEDTLVHTLRETLGYMGTKIACDHGSCGACTVIMDGEAILSCVLLTIECDGRNITTIEGLEDAKTGELDPIQQAFIDYTAFQCGFCTPGIIMTTKAMLDKKPSPTEEEVKQELAGHFCRCGSQYLVLRAIRSLAEKGR